jgi:hypothetical protein
MHAALRESKGPSERKVLGADEAIGHWCLVRRLLHLTSHDRHLLCLLHAACC